MSEAILWLIALKELSTCKRLKHIKCKTQSCFCCSSKVIPITSFSPLIKPYLRVSRRHIDLQTASIRHSTLCLLQTFHKHISGGIKLTLFWSLKTDWVKLKLLFCSNIIFCKLIVRIIHPFLVRTLWFTAVKTAGGCRTLTEQLKAGERFTVLCWYYTLLSS